MRLPALTELTPRQQEVSDAIAAKRGATRGPFLIWLRSPELAEKVDALGAYCRFDSRINERLRELSLLIAARHFDAQYSWNAHHKKAIEAGVSAASIEELASNQVPHFAHADEQLLYALATQILGEHFVDQATFDAGLAEWGGRASSTSSAASATSPCWRCCSTRSRSTSSPATPSRSPTCAASPGSTRRPRNGRPRPGMSTRPAGKERPAIQNVRVMPLSRRSSHFGPEVYF
jgi:4-carboxymuconolactone decarboxylase